MKQKNRINMDRKSLCEARICMGFVFTVLMLCLTACGAEGSRNKKEAPKVSEAQKKAQRREDFFRKLRVMDGCVVTERCIYEPIIDELKDDEIVQKDRQGKELLRHKLRMEDEWDEMLGGSGKRLLYSTDEVGVEDNEESDEYYIWQIPIKQTGSSETLLWNQKEKLVRFDGMEDHVYLLEPYLVYYDGSALVRLDLESRKKEMLDVGEDNYSINSGIKFCDIPSEDSVLYVHNGGYDDYEEAEKGADGLYRIDIKEWKAEKIYSNEDIECRYELIAVENGIAYLQYVDENGYITELKCYDFKRKKRIGCLSSKEIGKFLDSEHMFGDQKRKDERYLWIGRVSRYGKQIYIVCGMEYVSAEDGEGPTFTDKGERMTLPGHVVERLISFPEDNLSNLSYERELSDWWYENTARKEGEDDFNDDCIYHVGSIGPSFENELYFAYRDQKAGENHIMIYDLDTKKMTEVGKEELAYQVLYPISGLAPNEEY